MTPTPRPRKRSGPSCQLLVNSQPESSSPAEVTTGGNYGDVERKRRHLAAFSSSTSHEQLMQTRKRGGKRKAGKKKGLLDPPPAPPTGKLQVDSTYKAKICHANRTVFGGSTGNKSVFTVGCGALRQLRHTRAERTSCRRTIFHTIEQLPAKLAVGISHFRCTFNFSVGELKTVGLFSLKRGGKVH